ncbi:RNA polymerase sigma factor [Chitinophaga sp. RAB17]|uniref:RNA polymerase sigma factor n=1 Tax=Chitinophaga sp. RAB17 TaxID=3233049 RepID=UPI003F9142CA
MSHTNEQELLLSVAKGDEHSFQTLVKQYWPQIYGTALRLNRLPQQAKDLSQDIFVKLWNSREKLPEVESTAVFIYVSARKLIRDHLRKKVLHTDNLDTLTVQLGAAPSSDHPLHLPARISEETFEALFNQYMTGSLSAADLRLFRSMAMLPENKILLSQLLQDAFTDPAFAAHADFNADEMGQEIMQKVQQNEAITPEIHRMELPLISRSWFKYVAAAAIFLLLLAGSWQWHLRQQRRVPLLTQPVLLPAAAGLMLQDSARTLSDSAASAKP